MKSITSIIIISLVFFGSVSAQNITNTLGLSGTFSIKDGSVNFFTLSQSTGSSTLNGNLILPAAQFSSSNGNIFRNTERFIHNYQRTGTAGYNTFIGLSSGNFSLLGTGNQSSFNTGFGNQTLSSLTTGSFNSAMGFQSMNKNTSGSKNSAFGYQSLYNNTTGNNNSAMGYQSMFTNTSGTNNSAFGFKSLYSNTSGSLNSAFGESSLYSNITGNGNSAFGNQSLFSNLTGNSNSAFGGGSLFCNTTGSFNSALGTSAMHDNTMGDSNSAMGTLSLTKNINGNSNCALGYSCMYNNISGSKNTALGENSLYGLTTGNGNTCLGKDVFGTTTGNYNTIIRGGVSGNGDNNISMWSDITGGSNQVIFGRYIYVSVAWSVTSDRRLKSNISDLGYGLQFIRKLKPVSYIRKNDNSGKREYGFIAQEVNALLNESGITGSGMINVSDEGIYGIRYNDLIAPIVKAITELKEKNDKLRAEKKLLEVQTASLDDLEKKAVELSNIIKTMGGKK